MSKIENFQHISSISDNGGRLIRLTTCFCSCGGNVLINVGPTSDGMIAPIFEDRLRAFGSWLQVNGEAIYASIPWAYQNDTVTSYVWHVNFFSYDYLGPFAPMLVNIC